MGLSGRPWGARYRDRYTKRAMNRAVSNVDEPVHFAELAAVDLHERVGRETECQTVAMLKVSGSPSW